MKDFLDGLFQVERDMVRMSYWISALKWGYYSEDAEVMADEVRRLLDSTIMKMSALRGIIERKVG